MLWIQSRWAIQFRDLPQFHVKQKSSGDWSKLGERKPFLFLVYTSIYLCCDAIKLYIYINVSIIVYMKSELYQIYLCRMYVSMVYRYIYICIYMIYAFCTYWEALMFFPKASTELVSWHDTQNLPQVPSDGINICEKRWTERFCIVAFWKGLGSCLLDQFVKCHAPQARYTESLAAISLQIPVARSNQYTLTLWGCRCVGRMFSVMK